MEKIDGYIELIIGPMFAGKSTELLRKVNRYHIAGKNCIYVKYSQDTRYCKDEQVATHDLVFSKGESRALEKLSELGSFDDEYMKEIDVVGIDEGEFFPDIVEFSEEAANRGKVIIIAALDATFRREGFDGITGLIPLSEKIHKLSAICRDCGNDAFFSFKLDEERCDGIEAKKPEELLIGGYEMYKPLCRNCYIGESKLLDL